MKPFLKLQSLPEVLSLLAGFSGKDEAEEVPLDESLGRYLAEDLVSDQDVPGFCRSTVDGFAVRAQDVFGAGESQPALLELAESCRMGVRVTQSLEPGQAAPILTGGMLPKGSDAVVMLEYSRPAGNDLIELTRSVAPGDNVLARDEDVAEGMLCLKKGLRIRPQDVGLLAALGRTRVSVARRPRVAIISTGDELVPPEGDPGPGQVRDVNGPLVAALLAQAGAEPVPLGIVPDREELLREAVEKALERCHCVVLSGGSSVGEKDAACRVMASLGEVLCHGVAMKPGKPTLLGRAGGKPILGLPGHPVAALFTAKLFLIPLLARLEGRTWAERTVSARLAQTVPANHGRAQYTGVTLEEKPDGLWAVPIRGKSGLITTLAGADGFFCVPRDREGVPAGEAVEVSLFG